MLLRLLMTFAVTCSALFLTAAGADEPGAQLDRERLKIEARYLEMSQCSRINADDVNKYTEYKGNACSLLQALIRVWKKEAELVASLNAVQARRPLARNPQEGGDLYMQISHDILVFKGRVYHDLHDLFGSENQLDLQPLADLRDTPDGTLNGFSFTLQKYWEGGTWPFNQSGWAAISGEILEDADGGLQVCLNDSCLVYNGNGQIMAEGRGRHRRVFQRDANLR